MASFPVGRNTFGCDWNISVDKIPTEDKEFCKEWDAVDKIKTIGVVVLCWVVVIEFVAWFLYTHNILPDFYGLKGWLYFLIIPTLGMVVFIEWFFLTWIFMMLLLRIELKSKLKQLRREW